MGNDQKSLLIHICCAPCLSGLSDYLKSKGFAKIKGYFYNPNIHPYREFKKRRHNVRQNEKFFGFDEIEYSDHYPLSDVLNGMISANDRCESCFTTRLDETARKAKEENFSHFTTTLLISPYQNREILIKIGNLSAEKFHVQFMNEDMRRFYELSREISEKCDMYRQGYCGCIFSEYERYSKNQIKNSGD